MVGRLGAFEASGRGLVGRIAGAVGELGDRGE